jgi:ubiquinone biosynthesis protein Coq4
MPKRLLSELLGEDVVDVLSERLTNSETAQCESTRLAGWLSDERLKEVYADCYLPAIPDISILKSFPNETLGYELGTTWEANNFTPKFYQIIEGDSPHIYFRELVARSHDIWHLVTRFPFTVAGEVGLQSILMAQQNNAISQVLISMSLMSQINGIQVSDEIMSAITRGWSLGKKMELPLLSVRWEEFIPCSLDSIRQKLRIDVLL